MSKSKQSSKTKKTNSRKKSFAVPVLCGVLAVLAVVAIIALCNPKTPPKGEFIPPEFDPAAVVGTPEVDKSLAYEEVYAEGMAYRLSVCCVPTADEYALTVYFTSPESNEKYLKLRVLDKNGKTLGETGLLRPGEYVEQVTLSKKLSPGTKIKLKVMSYEPEDYTSAGSIGLNTEVGGTSYRWLWIVLGSVLAVAAVAVVAVTVSKKKQKAR